jgi:FHS family L-fucose permease-like MFS transporter
MNIPAATQPSEKKTTLSPIIIIASLFFIFGFVTWLNSTLIVFLKIACQLEYLQAFLVATAFYISYFVMALPCSWVLHKTGFKNGMALGLSIMAFGSLLFIPAAITRAFWIFLIGLFVQGAGLTILQTATNPYVTIIGPIESAAKRISIMGICNKVAGMLSPMILGFIVLKNADEITIKLNTLGIAQQEALLNALSHRVILPYVVMAGVLLFLSLTVRLLHLPEIDTDSEEPVTRKGEGKKRNLFQFPHLVLGFVAIFAYVGVEVISIDTIIPYGEFQGFALKTARLFSSFALSFMVVGYFIGIITIPRLLKQNQALTISAILGILFSVSTILTSGMVSITALALLGLANAVMWPAIWPMAIADLGKFTKAGSALLIMGIAGGAILPLVYGHLADSWQSRQIAYWIMVPCYLFIFYFSVHGYKLRR